MIPIPSEKALIGREKEHFFLKLNKGFYDKKIVQKAMEEDRDWIDRIKETKQYFFVRCKTSDMEDVLNWANYLIYLSKGDV